MSVAASPLAAHLHATGLWPVAAAALRHLGRLPKAARTRWAGQPLGQIVIARDEQPHYEPGLYLRRDLASQAVLVLTPEVVANDPAAFWAIVGAWLDHWLGCGASTRGPWLSQGGTPPRAASIAAAAAALQAVLVRGYAADALALAEPRALFARALALAMTEPLTLSAADPHLARWLQTTLLEESWWRRLH
ncbi:MAG: hypothetical protein M5U01_29355 [Ardenticatenaceae bacterium]|nr:hypothetical protein [Ardenticatenaceae bacterium]